MRIIKSMRVPIVVIGLVLQSFIGQVFASETGNEIAQLNANPENRSLLEQTAGAGLPLAVKPIADEEKNVLMSAETQATYLLNQAAGDVECHQDCTDYIFNNNTCKTVCREIGSSSSGSGGGGMSRKGCIFTGVLIGGMVATFPGGGVVGAEVGSGIIGLCLLM